MTPTRTILAVCLLLCACKKEEEITYTQINGTDDSLTVEVGVDELLDRAEIALTSSTGQVEVGSAFVDPAGGPIGTEHEIVVEVYDAYEDLVDRASVRVSAEGRGDDEYDLDRDSADEGFYKIVLETNGAEGEVRTDTLTFRLWDSDADVDDVGTEDSG